MEGKIVPDIVKNQIVKFLSSSDTARAAAKLMTANHISAILVSDDDKLLGIVTERDLTTKVIAGGLDPETTSLMQVMTPNPDIISPDDTPIRALELMRMRGYRHLPVADDNKVFGIVSIRDLYTAMKDQLEEDIRQREAFIFGTGYGANI
jgi:CBS domain-containing protein